MPSEILLEVRDVFAGYGDGDVLRGVNLDVKAGEIVSVLGSNGVGKSTLNRTISASFARGRAASTSMERPLNASRRHPLSHGALSTCPRAGDYSRTYRLTTTWTWAVIAAPVPGARGIAIAYSPLSRGFATVAPSGPEPSPAANSKCSPSVAG